MFQTPAASVVSSTSRRSTRGAARSASGGSSKIDTSHRQSRKRKKKTSILRPLLTKAGPVRKWAQVYRAPAENVGFKTLKWVPLEELTFEEKLAWNEDQQKPRGKVLTDSQEEKQAGEKIDDSGNSSDDEDDVGSSNRSYDASAS
mmetsp:Transcript_4634/g.8892  ORF Transcript_4634/g.8892 Transcript_4634/m.8892 type:complete len:145 (+) Transcript_4634:1982-2416(+)